MTHRLIPLAAGLALVSTAFIACSSDSEEAGPSADAGLESAAADSSPGDTHVPPPTDAADAAPAPLVPYATWSVAPSNYNDPTPAGPTPPLAFTNQTLRHLMQTSVGGEKVRVRLSNVFGSAPLVIDGAHVALAKTASEIDPTKDHVLEVGGAAKFTIPMGAEVWSDPVPLAVAAHTTLAVSIFVSAATPTATVHRIGLRTLYVGDGDQLAAATITAPTPRGEYFWVTGIDVYRREATNVVVAFGDSLTDGIGSSPNTDQRYPNYLSKRFAVDTSARGVSVVNEGLAGNRVTGNGPGGPSAQNRFDRDVLAQSGVTHVVLLEGVNDAGFCNVNPMQCPTSEAITTGLGALITKAKGKGLKVALGTLTPFKGAVVAGSPWYSVEAEAKRQAINTWIRANTAGVELVIDFDTVAKDPADAEQLNPTFKFTDNLHLNPAGYEALANAIDLTKFR